jgi:hypothetical protein
MTLTINFMPWTSSVAQKTIKEIASISLEKNLKQKYQQFYLLGDLGDRP